MSLEVYGDEGDINCPDCVELALELEELQGYHQYCPRPCKWRLIEIAKTLSEDNLRLLVKVAERLSEH